MTGGSLTSWQIARPARLVSLALLLGVAVYVLGHLSTEARGRVATAGGRISPGGNVVLVVCDTFRADHLGLYGYPRPTSPFLDSLAARAWVYDKAYSHYSYTWPTVSNLFTGLPYSRLVQENLFTTPAKGLKSGGLSARNRTLAQRLVAVGVTTVGISANPYVNSDLGFAKGFVRFHDVYTWNPNFWNQAIHKYTAEEVNAAAAGYLDRLAASDGPWFLYLHYFDPHMPYVAPAQDRALFEDPSYRRTGRVVDGYFRDPKGNYLSFLTDELKSWVEPPDVAHLVAQYDAEIHHLDRGLAALFRILESKKLLDRTTVVITADHGEAFLERRFWGHGFLSRAEEEHVPLIVVPPRRDSVRPARIRDVTTTTDIHYSILGYFGAPSGQAGANPWWSFDLFSRRRRHTVAYTEGAWDTAVLRSAKYSYYRHTGLVAAQLGLPVADGEYLFDLESDPGEKRDLFLEDGRRASAIRSRMAQAFGLGTALLPAETWGEPFEEADAESKRRLKALGYAQ